MSRRFHSNYHHFIRIAIAIFLVMSLTLSLAYSSTKISSFLAFSPPLKIALADEPDTVAGDAVLVIINSNSPESREVGLYYQKRRQIPDENIVDISTTTELSIGDIDFVSQIQLPIRSYVDSHNLKSKIMYLVLTYGIPYKIIKSGDPNAQSVDNFLANLYDVGSPTWGTITLNGYNRTASSCFQDGRHSPGIHFFPNTGYLLVTRLDGPTVKIAKGLVDKAIYAQKYIGPNSGKAYIAGQPYLSDAINTICQPIMAAGYECLSDPSHAGGANPLWHVSGGNDYISVWPSWQVGAVPIHFQSFTAVRTIRDTDDALVVPNLLAADATATVGNVAEPSANLVPQPLAFYDYFFNGNPALSNPRFNFAESIYLSARTLHWRWLAIGDPLYQLSATPVADTEPPQIDNFIYQINGDKIHLAWENDTSESGSPEVTYGELSYGNTPLYGTTLADSSPLTYFNTTKKNYLSEHHFTLDYDPTKNYFFKAVATDPAGNISEKTLFIKHEPGITIFADPTRATHNQTVTYTITVTNNSTATFQNLKIAAPIPAEVDFVLSADSGILSDNNVVFNAATTPLLLSLPPDQNIILTYQVKVK